MRTWIPGRSHCSTIQGRCLTFPMASWQQGVSSHRITCAGMFNTKSGTSMDPMQVATNRSREICASTRHQRLPCIAFKRASGTNTKPKTSTCLLDMLGGHSKCCTSMLRMYAFSGGALTAQSGARSWPGDFACCTASYFRTPHAPPMAPAKHSTCEAAQCSNP